MDIAALSIGLSQASLGQSVEIALTKKAMDTAQQNSVQMIKMLEAPHPNLGNTIDLKA
ncbi:YjfB family protein [Bacillus sp. FJAT-49736]|uniref:YjfB family protein n=1 Tax=Bacillus sp. FJAT-49736 TaxID=2833582 RepID=UPI001BC8D153|nr:YjfB family protein [Bacillus sp. FJAT-49736]MBS4172174.1 YjfB family protein [Bacillus sp. FJAT-49736]